MYNQLKKKRQEEGFTLIELLIVIVILGILAAIVVFSVQGITDKGKTSACKTNLSEVQTAIQAYYANNQTNSWPKAMGPAVAPLTPADVLVPNFLASPPPASDVTVTFDATGATAPSVSAPGCP